MDWWVATTDFSTRKCGNGQCGPTRTTTSTCTLMTGIGPTIGTGTEMGTVLELVLVLGLILVLELLLVPWRQVLGDRARLQQELQLGGPLQHPMSGLRTDSSWVWLVLLGRGRALYDKGSNNESYGWYWLFKVALKIDHNRFKERLLCLPKMPRFSFAYELASFQDTIVQNYNLMIDPLTRVRCKANKKIWKW